MCVVILTGSGISAESGISTFRDNNGLWEKHNIEEIATMQGYEQNPHLIHKFYNERRKQSKTVEPNAAHYAISKLQKQVSNVYVITQNVDNLHERSGSDVLHMHGTLFQSFCTKCSCVVESMEDTSVSDVCPSCKSCGTMRPNVVWFGEYPYHADKINDIMEECTYFIAIGTSGVVYPASGMVDFANQVGAKTIEINLNKTAISGCFSENIYGKATEIVPSWVETFMGELG